MTPPSNAPDEPSGILSDTVVADIERRLRRRVLKLEPMAEGHSGLTYRVHFDGEQAILRLPPAGVRIAGPADVARQGRIMAALHDAGMPVPAIIAMADEPVVGGRPFVLMEAVAGERIEKISHLISKPDIAISAVEVLAKIHRLPAAQTGIGDEDSRGLVQEIHRWSWLLERAPQELTAGAPELARELLNTAPAERPPALVHGDFHYGNLLFDGSHVVSVLDWEIAHLGQPLIDLGCLLMVSAAARSADPDIALSVPGAGGFAVPDEVLRKSYGEVSHEELNWYATVNFYKLAAILGYNLMLHRRGKRPDAIYETRTGTIRKFLEEGIRRLR